MRQAGLTVITEIHSGRAGVLPAVLRNAQAADPFGQMSRVHYAAFVILPEIDGIPERLVMETNYDGDLNDHLEELVDRGGAVLDSIYQNCRKYPAGGSRDRQAVKEYFTKNSVSSAAFYVALPGRSREDIDNAIEVYEAARTYLQSQCKASDSRKLSVEDVWKKLVKHFRDPSTPQPIRSPVSQRQLTWCSRIWALILLIPSLLLLILLPFLLVIARIYECHEARTPMRRRYPPNPLAYEYMNLGRQNHMCTLATVKLSRFRAVMIRLGLFLTKVLASKIFLLGRLDTITTIHFARWSLIDKNRHVLFLTNYDGSWSSYIDDFSNPPHLNGVWGNTERFPPTRFMLWQGAKLIQQFQAHVVEEFQPAYFFHRPYGDHTVQNLLRYLEFRDALARALG